MKICYESRNFSASSLALIETANRILEDYSAQGYDLTLRQLYYQFVAKGLIANKDTEYKRLGSIINDARLAGMVDWDHITDRTRNMRQNAHWDSPQAIVETCAKQFELDKWATQDNYVEVWVEKDALIGVIEVACQPLDVPYFSCRGYTSQSEMWVASQRIMSKIRMGKHVTIIHLGDHDPSGIDMSRDIEDRTKKFLEHHLLRDHVRKDKAHATKVDEDSEDWVLRTGYQSANDCFELKRIALNRDQINQYNPPPNPAKLTDARARGYVLEHGGESFELDALEPNVLVALIRENVQGMLDYDAWVKVIKTEKKHRDDLGRVAGNWELIVDTY